MTNPFAKTHDNPEMPGVIDIDPQELWAKKEQVVVIDVRRPDEFTGELGHIAKAVLLTLDTLPQRLEEIPADKCVVFVCRSGGRSARACAFAAENGIENVFNLKGGMLAWSKLNLAVEEKT